MNAITAALLRTLPLPRHEQGDNKEGRGQVLVVGGCASLPGAILLSAEAALRAGAGKLQVATCQTMAPHLGVALPEAMVIGLPETSGGCIAGDAGKAIGKQASRADAILVGPGMMAEDAGPMLGHLLEAAGEHTGFVLDAGALDVPEEHAQRLSRCGARTVVTPHAGEMAAMLGTSREAVTADPLRHAQRAAARFCCTVVMKGTTTHVVAPGGETWNFDGGPIGLGTSGSGDVLAGIIAGLLARGTPATEAAMWGVYLHAEAGTRLTQRYGGIGLLARELPGEIPAIMAGVTACDQVETPDRTPLAVRAR